MKRTLPNHPLSKSVVLFTMLNRPLAFSLWATVIHERDVPVTQHSKSISFERSTFHVSNLILKPLHYAIFRIGITAPNHEGIFQGQAFVETQYEKINVPFSLRTAKGALKADELFFENSFPGKISTQSLYVHSTFSHSMTITGITTVPDDSRFIFDPLKHGTPVLNPNSKNMVHITY
ncbi:UNVERIFIED_CONTAM: transmembrane protein [Trichonephila clavipes]